MNELLEALENAIAQGQHDVARGLLHKLRERCQSPDAFSATAEVAPVELDGSREPEAIARFIERIERAFDPDCDV